MHFALVHGAYHGAWCWDLVRKELERDGHSTSAVDLPCEDPDAGAERYADLVVKAIPEGPASVVLVGHSLGGLTIPVAASMTPTLMTVYLCALVPVPGLSFDAQQAKFGTGFRTSEPAIGHADGSASWPEAGAIEVFFHDCDPQIARDAAARLRRQFWRGPRRSRRCVNGLRPARLTSFAPTTEWFPGTTAGAPREQSWESNHSRSRAGIRPSCRARESWPAPSNTWPRRRLPASPTADRGDLNDRKAGQTG